MQHPEKIALLGFDCALTSLVRKHIAEGICPNFKHIFENGVVCENALVPYPTITPPNWTVMATGAWPITTQVTDFWRHIPGTTPVSANTTMSFNWDYCEAESIWEAAEKAGKKSVILNFPMSFNVHKKLKNAIVVGGSSLTPGIISDYPSIEAYPDVRPQSEGSGGYIAFCGDTIVSTQVYPGECATVKFGKSDWKNVPDLGKDDPLSARFPMKWPESAFEPVPETWHILLRDMQGKGYDTVTLSPTLDYNDAFCTLKSGEWANAFNLTAHLKNRKVKELRCKPKLMQLSDDAEDFTLIIPHMLNKDGALWCYPPEKAALLNKGDNISTNNTGFLGLSTGWIDLDTWMEFIANHYDWLGDAAEALLGEGDWDLFYTHAHPTDYIYHALMTELDPSTCSSKAAHEKAWECHRKLYISADRYLGRLLKLMTEKTLVTLISDHGATPDGPPVSTQKVLEQAGLCVTQPIDWENPILTSLPENARETAANAMFANADASKSKALAQRSCFVYVNLKGRDPEGIVEPEDYEKVQREIIDTLMTYVDPKTGKRPFILALPKKEAMLLGQGGKQCGDVVYALFPEFTMQHGPILPTSEYGIGTLKTLLVFYGPHINIKQGYSMERVCNIVDCVPTFCYMTGWPIPKHAEGGVLYQIMENPNMRPC